MIKALQRIDDAESSISTYDSEWTCEM